MKFSNVERNAVCLNSIRVVHLCSSQAVVEAQPNLFTPFAKVSAEDLALYAPEDNEEALQTLLTAKMAEYNESNVAMNLVLFQQAI